MGFCSRCGNKVAEGDLYCSECGAKLEQIEKTQGRAGVCSKCGSEVAAGNPYCLLCGSEVERIEEPALEQIGEPEQIVEPEPGQIVVTEDQKRTLYEVLEVPRTANHKMIEISYRLLSERYNPDANPSPDAAIRMQEINSAYDVLGDPWKRIGYDKTLEREEQIGEPQAVDSVTHAKSIEQHVAEQLDAGTPGHEIAEGLSDAGLDRSEAEELVDNIERLRQEALNQERKKAGTKDLGWGLVLLIVGMAITLGTWAATDAGGSYWIMWGPMVAGAFYLLRGFYRKIATAPEGTTRIMWVVCGVVLIGGMVGGGVAMGNMVSSPKSHAPSNSFIAWDDNSYWENETQAVFKATGTITNTHTEWSIENVVIKIEALDDAGKVIKTYDVSVLPSIIPPRGTGTYSASLQLPLSCAYANPSAAAGDWVPP